MFVAFSCAVWQKIMRGGNMQYGLKFYLGGTGKPNDFSAFIKQYYVFLQKFRELFPECAPFEIPALNTKYRRTGLSPYISPERLPDTYEEYERILGNLKESSFCRFRLFAGTAVPDRNAELFFVFADDNPMSVSIDWFGIGKQFMADKQEQLLRLVAETFVSFGFRYGIEELFDDIMQLVSSGISYGWAIIGPAEHFGQVREFPVTPLGPELVRVSSVPPGEIFDMSNPMHIQKGRELEALVRNDRSFVRKAQYLFAQEPRRARA